MGGLVRQLFPPIEAPTAQDVILISMHALQRRSDALCETSDVLARELAHVSEAASELQGLIAALSQDVRRYLMPAFIFKANLSPFAPPHRPGPVEHLLIPPCRRLDVTERVDRGVQASLEAGPSAGMPRRILLGAPFAFQTADRRVNWARLRSLDLSRITRDNDVRALMACVEDYAYGDLDRESSVSLSESALLRYATPPQSAASMVALVAKCCCLYCPLVPILPW